MYGLPSRKTLNFRNGGPISGPGTGISDDIPATVPEGSFIMPADSTQQIGLGLNPEVIRRYRERQAAAAEPTRLGFGPGSELEKRMAARQAESSPGQGLRPRDVPVNLSNGEHALSPEQVHAVGAQVLNAVKDITHVPAEMQARGLRPPEAAGTSDAVPLRVGFADGGAVQARTGLGLNPEVIRRYRERQAAAAEPTRLGFGPGSELWKRMKAARQSFADGGQVEDEERPSWTGMTYGQMTSREPRLPQPPRSAEPTIPDAVTQRFGELQSPGMGFRVQGQDLAEPGREMGAARTGTAQGAQERTFGAAGAASAGPAQEVAGNSFSHMSQQQRNDAGDAYRQAWQREAPGGLRRANGPALDYYNAEQQVRGTGITAQRGANGVMEFSGDGSNALPQNYTQGVDLNLANERMARANAIRGETTAIRDGANFNAGGALSRQASQDEITRGLLTGPSRSGRQVAAQLIAGQQQNALNQQRMVTDADLSRQRLGLDAQRVGFDQQRLGMDQAEHSGKMTDAAFVRQARQGLLDTADSTDQAAISRARAQAIAAGILKPESDAEQKVIYNEEALDPGNAMAGTRRVPMVLNRDGTATVVQPRTAPRGLPQGVSRDAALQSARRAIEMGYDRNAVTARLGEFGLSFEDLK